ncbi:30S ribosomal protein S6--L-glutamate ligase [Owenweeksia hongkongensis]|uniref:Probable alpha-L-glutamate ligase n=1 Tax=Owenweeksia hongkongensis (strain DSM 17368 / CIP 108786 / JCM 12287 / NRRL B-23963 / UST20020801) TaxID=926562 RepID=G8R1J8_OWEHD|nr:30S ribosomal protein S6--L-glutamate ligase [Owenweeksia hongkongensis]AEV31737.1 alpha-L-glutamate ligase, RimK family [Owenweeksia hongkongensis DSM 17368]
MKIVILSANKELYSTKRLKEAAEARGHEAEIINHNETYVVIESGDPKVFYGDHAIEGVDAIIPRIGASVTFYGSNIIRQFEMQKVFTTLSSLALSRSRDKLRATQILSRHGLGIPKTAFAKRPSNIEYLIQQVGGSPLIVKLLEGTQGLGVVLAETRKAAKSVIEAFYGLDANILVQEFIAEAGGSDLRTIVIDGKVVAAFKRQGKEGEFRSNLHRGGSGTLVKLTKEERAAAIGAAKALGLGIAGVDMLQSKRGPLILEVNSSPGLEGVEKATKVDVAGKIIEYIEKGIKKPQSSKKDKIGV